MKLSWALYGSDTDHKLSDVAKREGIDYKSDQLHRADVDTEITARAFVKMTSKIKKIS